MPKYDEFTDYKLQEIKYIKKKLTEVGNDIIDENYNEAVKNIKVAQNWIRILMESFSE